MKSVGIIGFGSFGRFLAEKLDTHCEVKVFSTSNKPNQWAASLEEVAQSDFVIPAVPLVAYSKVLEDIKPLLQPETVIVDVASVKEQPIARIQAVLPNQPLVATHPLFGPESAKDTIKGHVLVLCPEASEASTYGVVKQFAQSLELEIVEQSATDHDREMAVVQSLTFFIAHALKDMELHSQKLSTPSFQKLLKLAELERHHSEELFTTIQAGNVYAEAVRKRFLAAARELQKRLVNIRLL